MEVLTKFNVILILLFKCTGIKSYSLSEFLTPPPHFYVKNIIFSQAI